MCTRVLEFQTAARRNGHFALLHVARWTLIISRLFLIRIEISKWPMTLRRDENKEGIVVFGHLSRSGASRASLASGRETSLQRLDGMNNGTYKFFCYGPLDIRGRARATCYAARTS